MVRGRSTTGLVISLTVTLPDRVRPAPEKSRSFTISAIRFDLTTMVTLEFQKFWEPQLAMQQPKECIMSTGTQRMPTTEGAASAVQLENGDNVS